MAVRVPSAPTLISPVISSTLIMEPGCSFAGSPMRSSGAPPVEIPWRGSRPSLRICGANCSTALAVNPLSESGVATSVMRVSPKPAGFASGQRATATSAVGPARALARCGSESTLQHFLDGPDAGDGIFGVGKGQRDRADQFAIDVNRAAAHALHDAGMLERSAGKPPQDQRFLRAGIFQNAEDLNLKILDFVAVENRLADAVHARPDIFEGHDGEGRMGGRHGQQR